MTNSNEARATATEGPSPLYDALKMMPLQALFWQARFAPSSDVLHHVPALWWIVTTLNPRTAAVVGCGDGVLHFALCQAIEQLGSERRCAGFGFWTNPVSGKALAAAPADLQAHEEMLYEGVSQLVPVRSVEDAVAQMRAHPVNFLCVDLGALGSTVDVDVGAVMASIAGEGAVLVLESRRADGPCPAVPRDVARVDIGSGAYVLLGSGRTSGDGAFVGCSQDNLMPAEIRTAIRRSGLALVSAARGKALVQLRGRLKKSQAGAEADIKVLQETLNARRETIERQARSLIDLQSEVFDLRRRSSSSESVAEEARAEVLSAARMDSYILALNHAFHGDEEPSLEEMDQDAQIRRLIAEAASVVASRNDARGELALARKQASAEAEAHLEEVVQLTRIAEEWRNRVANHSALVSERDALRDQLQMALRKIASQRLAHKEGTEKFRARLRALGTEIRRNSEQVALWKAQVGTLQATVSELFASTSWRITAPLRGIGRWVKRGR